MATPPPPPAAATTVQHVTKTSSDQLLSKFADSDQMITTSKSQAGKMQLLRGGPAILRKKRSRRVASGLGAREEVEASEANASKVTKRRSIGGGDRALLPTHSARKESGSVRKKLGIVKAEHGTLMLLAALGKTWRKTLEGASKMFIERHCNTHVRLMNDIV